MILWYYDMYHPQPCMLEWWDVVLQKRLTWALFGVMGCGAAEATGLGFFSFFFCYQPSCVISQQSWFWAIFPPKISNFTPNKLLTSAAGSRRSSVSSPPVPLPPSPRTVNLRTSDIGGLCEDIGWLCGDIGWVCTDIGELCVGLTYGPKKDWISRYILNKYRNLAGFSDRREKLVMW